MFPPERGRAPLAPFLTCSCHGFTYQLEIGNRHLAMLLLVFAHRRFHSSENFVTDPAFLEFFQLVGGQIKIDGRLFDTTNDGPFREPCFDQLDDRIVCEALGFLEFR